MTALAVLSLVVWVYLVVGHGRFWRIAPDLLPQTGGSGRSAQAPGALAVVPARNEADVIGSSLPSLLAQGEGRPFHVLLVDDLSDDGTGEAARRAAEATGLADRLTVLRSQPLPAGWTGKLWAMHQGLEWASRQDPPPDYVLFTDADIRYRPGVVARLLDLALHRRAVLASLMVELRVTSFAERLLIPAFVYFFRMLYPFAWVRSARRATAAAAGGVVLAHRETLVRAGGLAAIRGSIIDDCALGALMKRHGPIWLGLTREVLSIRPYPGFCDIRRMVSRSAYAELRYAPWRLAIALLGLALVFVVPPVAAVFGNGLARLCGIAAWAMMSASFLPMPRFYRAGAATVLLLPLIAVLYGEFTLNSALQHWRGRGGAWKGRFQSGAGSAARP